MCKTAKLVIFIVLGVCVFSTASFAEVIDRIVAIVNDDIITLTELDEAMNPFLKKIESEGFSEEKKQKIIFNLKNDILSRMIDRKLTDQEVKRYKIEVTKAEVERSIERFKEAQSITHEQLINALEQDGLTYEEYQERMKKELVRPKLINYAVKSKIIITDEDIKAYYESHIKDFEGTRKYHLKNIIHKDKSEMDTVLEKLKNNESFTTLAMRFSQGKNAKQGELGKFEFEILSPVIQKSLEGLEKGQYTQVISTDLGYQIFFIEDIFMDGAKTLEEVSDQILMLLYNKEAEKKFTQWLEDLKKKAHIKKML